MVTFKFGKQILYKVLSYIYIFLLCPFLLSLPPIVSSILFRKIKNYEVVYYHVASINIIIRWVLIFYGGFLLVLFLIHAVKWLSGTIKGILIKNIFRELLVIGIYLESTLIALNIVFIGTLNIEFGVDVIDNFTFKIFVFKEAWMLLAGMIVFFFICRWGVIKFLIPVEKNSNMGYLPVGVFFIVLNIFNIINLDSNKYLSTLNFVKNINTVYFSRFDNIPDITENDKTYFKSVGISLNPPEYTPPHPGKKKNVVIILLESFDRAYLETNIPGFGSMAPNMNKFKKEAVYFKNFIGATQPTLRGVAAHFCGVFADLGNETFQENSPYRSITKNLVCFPDILKENGYEQIFISGESLPYFAHLDVFLGLHGYKLIPPTDYLDKETVDKFKRRYIFGVSDYIVAKKVIEELEILGQKNTPFNLTTYFLGTHGPWSGDYTDCPETGMDDNVVNAVHCVDYTFSMVWEYIKSHPKLSKNTVVALVADHSLEQRLSKYSEFIVPHYDKTITAVIYDPDTKGYVNETATYHPDFAPTLLGLMNFKLNQMYMGYNVTKKGRGSNYYVSPYITIENGKIVSDNPPCEKNRQNLLEQHNFELYRNSDCDRKKTNILMMRRLLELSYGKIE